MPRRISAPKNRPSRGTRRGTRFKDKRSGHEGHPGHLSQFPDGKQDTLDGLSIEYPEWRFNLWPSNTESFLTLNLEAESTQQLEEKLPLVGEVITTRPQGGQRE